MKVLMNGFNLIPKTDDRSVNLKMIKILLTVMMLAIFLNACSKPEPTCNNRSPECLKEHTEWLNNYIKEREN